MEDCNADLVLHVIQYLNIKDSSNFAVSSKRFYYLVCQYRSKLRGPDLVSVASWNHQTKANNPATFVTKQAVEKIQCEPDFVLTFQNPRSAIADIIMEKLPKKTAVLGLIGNSIQVNLPGIPIEHRSDASAMYGSFPNSVLEPFVIESDNEIDSFKTRLLGKTGVEWKAIIVYTCGSGAQIVESFLSKIQTALPDTSFVGGVCIGGYISPAKYTKEELSKLSIRELRRIYETILSNGTGRVIPPMLDVVEKSDLVDHIYAASGQETGLRHVEDGIFGIALGGDVPIRSMVSRGVISITHGGTPQPSSPYVVSESRLLQPTDEEYPFRRVDNVEGSDQLTPIHEIRMIRNNEESTTTTATQLMSKLSNGANFIGIKRPSYDGFELNMISSYCYHGDSYLLFTDGSPQQQESLVGSEIDFFVLDGDSCLQDMEATVSKLKEQTSGETILGAIMFSCNGRGPTRSYLIRENMADASRFATKFPTVPCLGFYAGGEIGPLALAGKQNVFQVGRAALQGFTAVFALFVVPVVEHIQRYNLDDCEKNVNSFFVEKWSKCK